VTLRRSKRTYGGQRTEGYQRPIDGNPLRVRLRGSGEPWDVRTWAARGRRPLVQCQKCGAKGTAYVSDGGGQVDITLPSVHGVGWDRLHAGCGGRFALYDTGGTS